MWILLLYMFCCLLLSYHYFIRPLNSKMLLCISVILFVLIALSFPLGRDINGYVFAFNRAESFLDAFKYDMSRNFGFNALMVITKWFTNSAIVFRVIINLIVTGMFAYPILKYSNNALFSSTLLLANGLFVVYFGSALRQAIAMGIFFIAYFKFYLKGDKRIYYVLSFLALSFHEASIILFILPLFDWIYNQFKTAKYYYLMIFGWSLIGFVVIAYGMPLLFDIIKTDCVFTHFMTYFKALEFSLMGFLLRICMILANTFIFLMAKNKSDNDIKMYNVLFLSFILYFCFSGFSIFSRIADFLAVIEIIFIPSMLSKISNKKVLFLSLIGIFCLTTVLFLVDLKEVCNIFESTNILDYPYVSIFNTDKILLYLKQI